MDAVDGEAVVLRARLSDRWTWFRFCTCSGAFAQLYPILAPIYYVCGARSRQEEAASFDLALTSTAIHFSQKLYACGCCCQTKKTMTIPLDKIQDVAIVADCCGDCCGFARTAGAPYQLHVQTAGRGTPEAELSVFCVENIEEFRSAVLQAKRALPTATPGTVGLVGAEKVVANPVFSSSASASAAASGPAAANQEMVVRILERIEQAINDGVVAELRAAREARSASAEPR